MAWTIEVMGGLMPWVLVTIFGKPAAPPPLPKPKVKPRKNAEPASEESVREWHGERIERREGCKLRTRDALTDYEAWCAANGKTPLPVQTFGKLMKEAFGIRKSTGTAKRTSYLDIALKPKKTATAATAKMNGAVVSPSIRHAHGEVPGDAGEAQDNGPLLH